MSRSKRWKLRTKDLAEAMETLRATGQGPAGHSSWRFEPKRLSIDWAGATVSLPVESDDAATILVDGRAMRGVTRLDLPAEDEHELRLDGGWLYWDGPFKFVCEEVAGAVPQLLPVSPRPLDIAVLPFRHPPEDIEAAGLSDEVAVTLREKAEAIEDAAEALKWLGITHAHVTAWVDAHLAASAKGQTTFSLEPRQVVVDSSGQIELLEGA